MAEKLVHVEVTHLDEVAVLRVRGDIDAYSVSVLQAALADLDVHATIQLDMADVRFMDSSGLNAILAHAARMEAGRGSIRICRPSVAVRRVVTITGLEAVLFETPESNSRCGEHHHGGGEQRAS